MLILKRIGDRDEIPHKTKLKQFYMLLPLHIAKLRFNFWLWFCSFSFQLKAMIMIYNTLLHSDALIIRSELDSTAVEKAQHFHFNCERNDKIKQTQYKQQIEDTKDI